MEQKNGKVKFLIIAAVLIIISSVLPCPEGLTRAGMQSFGVILGAIVLWVSEALNMAVTGIFMAALLVFLKVMSAADMFKGFGGSVFFFMVGTMSITTAMASTTIPTRIAGAIMTWAKKSPRKLVVGFAVGTALLSSIMSNIPTCALFASLGMAVLKANGDPKPGTSNLGKCLMIAIPAGSVIGGYMTPAGGPTNIIAMNTLASVGRPITFLQWMIQGYPIGLVITIIVALWLTFVHKPESISDEALVKANEMVHGNGPLTAREKKALAVIGLMFVAWIASSWVPVLNTTCVALMGTCLFMFPGIEVMTWDEYSTKGGWDASFMVGSVGALADAALNTGAMKWLINTTLGGAANWSSFAVFLLISFLVCIIHILVPSGPAVAGLAVVPIVELAILAGINPVGAAILVSFWSAVTFVLPTDAVPMFTYKFGYYGFGDMIKAGVPISVIVAVLVAVLIPAACTLLGC
ncbi:MAG: SLC13 family permease [Bacillota bacterium]|nr:SLC13 family permease [Bacillota bacterium]